MANHSAERGTPISTGMDPQEYLALQMANQARAAAAARASRPASQESTSFPAQSGDNWLSRNGVQGPVAERAASPRVESDYEREVRIREAVIREMEAKKTGNAGKASPEAQPKKEWFKKGWFKKIGKKAIAGAVIVGATSLGFNIAADNNPALGDFRDSALGFVGANLAPGQAAEDEAIGQDSDIIPTNTLGEDSFRPDLCRKPEGVLMALTASARMPLAPLVPVTEGEGMARAEGFLTAENGVQEDMLTESKYSEVIFEDMKMGISICARDSENSTGLVENKTDGTWTVDMSEYDVVFQDPDTIYKEEYMDFVTHVYNPTPPIVYEPSPDKGEYMVVNDPTYFLERADETDGENDEYDVKYNKALNDTQASISTIDQLNIVYALGQEAIVDDLDDPSDGEENISYPFNQETMKKTVQAAMANALEVPLEKMIFVGNGFNYVAAVKMNPATTKPITDPNKDGVNPLLGIDQLWTSNIIRDSYVIEQGGLSKPVAPKREPSPTPTPTPSPTE